MATNSLCAPCIRAIRSQTRKTLQHQRQPSRYLQQTRTTTHPFSTRSRQHVQTTTKPPSAATRPSEPSPTTPKSAPPPPVSQEPFANIAAKLRSNPTFKAATEPYIAYGSTEDLFRACNNECTYTIPSKLTTPPAEEAPKNSAGEDIGVGPEGCLWYASKAEGGCGLDVTFGNWAQICFLHMYILTVRLRCFPPEHSRVWHQNLLDHFFYAAEDRMAVWHGISSRSTRNKHLKDLWQQWRGVMLSYDEGIIRGDAVLATAVWRNVFKADVGADLEVLARVTGFLRRELRGVDRLSDEAVAAAEVRFGSLGDVKGMVEAESPTMRERISAEA